MRPHQPLLCALAFLATSGVACSSSGRVSSGGGDAGALSNDQIVGVASAASSALTLEAQLALARTSTPSVVSFANTMVSDAADANAQLAAVAASQGFTPQPSDAEEKIEADAQQLIDSIRAEHGAAFDLDYAQAQMTMDQDALSLVQEELTTDNPALAAYLQGLQATVQQHYLMAQTLVAGLDEQRSGR
jgi:predicted outer membrane protein